MTIPEFKLATLLAKTESIPWAEGDCLIGCGCEDFEPKCVSIRAVAALLRYQCICFNGSWDEQEYQNMRAILVGRGSKVTVSDVLSCDEARKLVAERMQSVWTA